MELAEYFVTRERSIRLIALAKFDTRCHAVETWLASKTAASGWT
jgi:hypothetical protein